MGSNMAENHPVAFRWPMQAKVNGAKLIHVDPRFTRTSALADRYVSIRPGSDIAFLGGIVNYILENRREFREYIVPYTNAATVIHDDFRDTEDLGGLFSGFDPEARSYDTASWQYEGAEVSAAAGIPPQALTRASWSWADTIMLLFVYVAAFLIAVKLVAWIDTKLSARRLFRDIYRELGIGKRPR